MNCNSISENKTIMTECEKAKKCSGTQRQKRIASIQDISCVGRCSLTVALPIISACGIETSIIPTAVLSTHTGGFTGYTYRDLTDDIEPISKHWDSLDLKFDAIYTGYLGSFRQISLVKDFIKRFKSHNTTVIIDPAMADNGVLYGGFSDDFPKEMATLCSQADIIVPNLTEAAFMLGEHFVADGYDIDYIEGLVRRLSELGTPNVVLTGVSLNDGNLGVAVYDKNIDETFYYSREKIDGYYHGTGDVYASALTAAFVNGIDINNAASYAVDFTVESIQRTKDAKSDVKYGVNFEQCLPSLMTSIGII